MGGIRPVGVAGVSTVSGTYDMTWVMDFVSVLLVVHSSYRGTSHSATSTPVVPSICSSDGSDAVELVGEKSKSVPAECILESEVEHVKCCVVELEVTTVNECYWSTCDTYDGTGG